MAVVDAEEARQACSKAILKIATGQHMAAAAILEAFGGKCADLVQGEKMAKEQADLREDRYDLAAVTVDLRSEALEREKD